MSNDHFGQNKDKNQQGQNQKQYPNQNQNTNRPTGNQGGYDKGRKDQDIEKGYNNKNQTR